MTGPEVPPDDGPDDGGDDGGGVAPAQRGDGPTRAPEAGPSGLELAGMGVFLAAVVVIPLVVGLRIDDALGSSPAGLVLGLVLGILAGFAGVYVRFRRYA
jgi:hypothetical protein